MALGYHRLKLVSSMKFRRPSAVADSGVCHRSLAAWRRDVPPPPSGLLSGSEKTVEKLWRVFFSDPSLWWDHRLEKGHARYPDFKHKETKEALWLNGRLNPPWVEAELAAMSPGTVERNPFSWNTRLASYVKSGQCGKAMDLYRQMQVEGLNPDTFTFVSVLNACATLQDLEMGKRIHAQIIQSSCEMDVFVGNGLVDMYCKCGSIEDAERVFHKMPTRDVVVWNAMILGCVKCGQGGKALELSHHMQREGMEADSVTYVGMLNACASLAALKQGKEVHAQIFQTHCRSVFVDNSLIDMYAKCGSMEDAWQVFNDMPIRNAVSWNNMILGHVKHGQGQKALELWHHMKRLGVRPDGVTFVAVLNASASVVALEEGRDVHNQIVQSGFEDVIVANSVVDMYAKCGSVEDAVRVFEKMPSRNSVSWNTMLGGYALHGLAEAALKHFRHMCQEGVEMDKLTFVSLLSACSHAGLVDEGLHYFECMNSLYRVPATVEHFACMVDLLGRAGRLREAEDLIKKMPCEPDFTVWMSMLGACRVHGNVELAENVAQQITDLDPGNSAGYVLLSNIYAAAGRWGRSADIQQRRLERGVKKHPGRTWIEVNREVHSFTVDDREHPQVVEIHAELKRLSRQMKEIGYETETGFLLHGIEDDEGKASRLESVHSEKLAIAFGLLNTNPGTPLLIFKNLRVCRDCHTATKLIAKIAGRAIIVRDANRFHHFQDGLCSCKDYW